MARRRQDDLKSHQHQKREIAKAMTRMVNKIRREVFSPALFVTGVVEDGDCSRVTAVTVTVGGNCIVLHCGCLPLMRTFVELAVGITTPPEPLPLRPLLLLLPLPPLLLPGVGVAVSIDVLLASMLGWLLICHVEAASAVRA